MKRRHELICREGFDNYLSSRYPQLDRKWEEPEIDPPDWYIYIGDYLYAVEATSITEYMSVGQGDPVPSPAVMTSLTEFVDEIEQEAIDQGILSGAYLISLAPIPNLRKHKKELISRFLDYISNTKDVPSAPEHSLGKIHNNRVSIVKMHNRSSFITEMISGGVKSGHDAQVELEAYLADAIATKQHKLQGIGDPLVLLILDAYHYSHLSDWSSAIATISGKQAFQAIVRVSSTSEANVIWPPNEWLGV
jgi:hypothetical protein